MKPQNDVILKLLEIESKRSLESAKTKTKKLSASSQKSRKKIEQDEEADNNNKNKNNVDLFKNNIFVEMEIAKRHDMPAPLISEILVENIKKNSSTIFFILFL